jgi:hypothetical protein
MIKVSQVLDANLAPEPFNPVKILELAVGGGKIKVKKNVGYTK